MPTRNFEYWLDLQQQDADGYRAEKHRIAEAVITLLERMVPEIRPAIEVIDVSTPATVIRYTGNWKGSMEGWLLTPGTGYKQLPNAVPGLRQFLMVGQWIMPGGGLPSGLLTARSAIQAVCRHDRTPFAVQTAGDDMTRKRSFTLLALGFGSLAFIATRVSRVACHSFLKHIEHLRQTLEKSPKPLAVRTDLPPRSACAVLQAWSLRPRGSTFGSPDPDRLHVAEAWFESA